MFVLTVVQSGRTGIVFTSNEEVTLQTEKMESKSVCNICQSDQTVGDSASYLKFIELVFPS